MREKWVSGSATGNRRDERNGRDERKKKDRQLCPAKGKKYLTYLFLI